jgi:hypothetical protein
MKIELVIILHDLEQGNIKIAEAYKRILNLFEECDEIPIDDNWEREL